MHTHTHTPALTQTSSKFPLLQGIKQGSGVKPCIIWASPTIGPLPVASFNWNTIHHPRQPGSASLESLYNEAYTLFILGCRPFTLTVRAISRRFYPRRLTSSTFVRRKRNNSICPNSKDVHRTKYRAFTITRLTHFLYTAKIARIRYYTMPSTICKCKDV